MSRSILHSERLQSLRRLSSVVRWMLALAVIACVAKAEANEPVHSPSRKFRIPFQYDQEQLKKLGAVQVELSVSLDQGANWEHYESVDPEAGHFTYIAESDGEYWFSVRTHSSGGLTYPNGPPTAELKVIVDTTAPELRLDLVETKSGTVSLKWNADDPHLNPESLKLKFLDPQLGRWESVQVKPVARGQTSWTVRKAGLIEVRGTVADQAGNAIEAESQTIIAGLDIDTDNPAPIADNTTTSAPEADTTTQTPAALATMDGSQGLPKLTSRAEVDPDEISPQDIIIDKPLTPIQPSNTVVQSNPSNAENATSTANDAVVRVVEPMNTPGSVRVFEFPQNAKQAPQPANMLERQPTGDPKDSTSRQRRNSTANKPENASDNSSDDGLVLPQHESKPRDGHLVNSNSFQIAYQLQDVGPSGVARIELYITEDNGASWFHYGSDDDLVSPMTVVVPRDGDYGFAFRIRNGVGLIATPPQPGHAPEIRVTVDRTQPYAEIQSVHRLEPNSTQLIIKWTAQDRELHEYPVALFYSTQPNGPWELIAGWTKNTGNLVWTPPPVGTPRYYIRLDVRDAAGNVARIDNDRPFTVDTARPKVKITDIESLRTSDRRP